MPRTPRLDRPGERAGADHRKAHEGNRTSGRGAHQVQRDAERHQEEPRGEQQNRPLQEPHGAQDRCAEAGGRGVPRGYNRRRMSPESQEHAQNLAQGPRVWVARSVILALIVVCLAIGDLVLAAILVAGWIVSETMRVRQVRRHRVGPARHGLGAGVRPRGSRGRGGEWRTQSATSATRQNVPIRRRPPRSRPTRPPRPPGTPIATRMRSTEAEDQLDQAGGGH